MERDLFLQFNVFRHEQVEHLQGHKRLSKVEVQSAMSTLTQNQMLTGLINVLVYIGIYDVRHVKTQNVDDAGSKIAVALFVWIAQAVHYDVSIKTYVQLRQILQAIFLWLVPVRQSRTVRQHVIMWQIATSMCNVMSLHELMHYNACRGKLRLMMRAMNPVLQAVFLQKNFKHKAWFNCLKALNKSVWLPDQSYAESGCYFLWNSYVVDWYVGKVNTLRHNRTKINQSGSPLRLKEHVLGIIGRFKHEGDPLKYRTFRAAQLCDLKFLLFTSLDLWVFTIYFFYS